MTEVRWQIQFKPLDEKNNQWKRWEIQAEEWGWNFDGPDARPPQGHVDVLENWRAEYSELYEFRLVREIRKTDIDRKVVA